MSKLRTVTTYLKAKRSGILAIALLMVANILITTFGPWVQITAAAGEISDTRMKQYEAVSHLMEIMNTGNFACTHAFSSLWPDSVEIFEPDSIKATGDDSYEDKSYYGFKKLSHDANTDYYHVGQLQESFLKGSGGDANISCVYALQKAMTFAYGSRQKALQALYDTSKKDGDKYRRNSKGDTLETQVYDKLDQFLKETRSLPNFSDKYQLYQRETAKYFFNLCYKFSPPANGPKDKTKPDNYITKDGKGDGTKMRVGWTTEIFASSNAKYEDGQVECRDLKDVYFAEKLYDKSIDDAAQNEIKSTRIREILNKDQNSRNIVKVCVAANDPDGLGKLDTAAMLTAVSSWIGGQDDTASLSLDPVKGTSVSAATFKKIRDCIAKTPLKDAINAVLATDIAAEIDDSIDTKTPENNSIGDCDFNNIVPSGWNKLNPVAWVKEFAQSAIDWFGCSVIKGVLGFVEKLNDSIDGYLVTDSDQYNSSAAREAWNRFLTIANIIFVIGFLIMLLSTALGLGVVDAYTVKKFLPRIILAIILANLSFAIIQIAVQLTNALGGAVESFILGPVSKSGLITAVSNSNVRGLVGVGVGAAATYAIVGLATGGIFALLPAVLLLLFAVVTAWAVITIRRVIILLLIVIAPFAIAMWALPGLENWAKRWWKLFIEMLMVYPIVKALIAAGMFTASLVYDNAKANRGDVNTGEALTVLGAIILPYLAMPAVFKLASSTLGNITGMVNNRSKGLIDRSRQLSAEKKKQGLQNIKDGNRFKGGKAAADGTPTNFRGRLNRSMQTATLLSKSGLRPGEMRGNIRSARNTATMRAAKEFMEKNETFRGFHADDDKLWAMMIGGGDITKIKEVLKKRAPGRFDDPNTLNTAAAEVARAYRESGGQAGLVAATMAQAGTGTGFNYGNKGGYNDDMYDSIARASGMDRNLAGMMLGEMRPSLKNSGRMEFSGGYANQAVILGKRMDALGNGGYIIDSNGSRTAYSQDQAMRDTVRDAYNSNAGAFIAGKKRTIEMAAPMVLEDIQKAAQIGPETAIRELANAAGKQDAAAQVAPQNAEAWYKGVTSQTLDVGTMHPEVREALGRAINTYDEHGNVVSQRSAITVQEAQAALVDNAKYQGTRREVHQITLDGARQAQLSQAQAEAIREQMARGATGGPIDPGAGFVSPF